MVESSGVQWTLVELLYFSGIDSTVKSSGFSNNRLNSGLLI